MKKQLLLLLTITLLAFYSCKKEHTPEAGTTTAGAKTYQVTFNVGSSLAASSGSLGVAAKGTIARAVSAPIPVATNYLTALVYDGNSNLIQRIDQVKGTTPNYGTMSANLSLGTVYVFIIATDDKDFDINISKVNADNLKVMPNGYPALTYPSAYFGPSTTSFYSTSRVFEVTGESVNTVNLTRAASQVNVVTKDLITSGTQYVYAQNTPNNQFDLLKQVGEHSGNVVQIAQSLTPTVGIINYTYSVIVWPGTGSQHTFALSGVTTKTLFAATDTIQPNTKYTFTGYLSNLRPTTGIITTDTTWSPGVNKTFSLRKTPQFGTN